MAKKRRAPNSKDRLRKAQLSFYPEPEDYEALKTLSAKTGVPQQVYLREGLRHILRRMRAAHAAAGRREFQSTQNYAAFAAELEATLRRNNATLARYAVLKRGSK
jgi:histidinol-phosphate/aromatic aminotransferase/cobyric acid decarboxylase-like protein